MNYVWIIVQILKKDNSRLTLSHLKGSGKKQRKKCEKILVVAGDSNTTTLDFQDYHIFFLALGSNPRWLLRFFTFFLCFFLDPFRWESVNLVFMNGQNLISKDNSVILVNYCTIVIDRHHGCCNILKKLAMLGRLSLLRLLISLLQVRSRCVPVNWTAPGQNYSELQDCLDYLAKLLH